MPVTIPGSPREPAKPQSPAVKLDPLAGLLSYLIPGLGQIVQGRVGKGILFFVCLYGLFFYGLSSGQFKNVWLPKANNLPDVALFGRSLSGLPKAISYRPQFLGQFWIGVAAWPAIIQYAASGPDLNDPPRPLPILGTYMRTPSEDVLNQLQRDGNKRWDLAWVYTLIAGALNVLVIYDALAGPSVRDDQEPKPQNPPTPPTGGNA